MRITYDGSADSAYVYVVSDIGPGEASYTYGCDPREVKGEISLDFDAAGRLLGIEVLDASRFLGEGLLGKAEIIGDRANADAREDHNVGGPYLAEVYQRPVNEQAVRITHARSADAAYIYLVPEIRSGDVALRSQCDRHEVNGLITLDFDADGRLLGIEVLDASRLLRKETLDEAEIIG